jgi:Holliday junction resolvase
MALESKLQKKIRVDLEKSGWIVHKVTSSKPGWPDLEAFFDGVVIFLEVKSVGKKASPLQEHRHKLLREQGFKVFVIDTWSEYAAIKYDNL